MTSSTWHQIADLNGLEKAMLAGITKANKNFREEEYQKADNIYTGIISLLDMLNAVDIEYPSVAGLITLSDWIPGHRQDGFYPLNLGPQQDGLPGTRLPGNNSQALLEFNLQVPDQGIVPYMKCAQHSSVMRSC